MHIYLVQYVASPEYRCTEKLINRKRRKQDKKQQNRKKTKQQTKRKQEKTNINGKLSNNK